MKRLAALKKEKEMLVLQCEREEEFLTNTLQKKLTLVRAPAPPCSLLRHGPHAAACAAAQLQEEKAALQKQLEHEQETVVAGLKRQLEQVTAEKQCVALLRHVIVGAPPNLTLARVAIAANWSSGFRTAVAAC